MARSAALDRTQTVAAARLDAIYSALASPQRREVLHVLAEAERNEHWAEDHFGARADELRGSSCCPAEVCACGLSEYLGLAASTVSYHMRRLIDAGLVSARKDGLWVYYRLERAALRAAAEALLEVSS